MKTLQKIDENKNINRGSSIIKIVCNGFVSEIIPKDNEVITLKQCREIAKNNRHFGTITVLEESPLNGYVYRYGNHGNYWERVGTLEGYA